MPAALRIELTRRDLVESAHEVHAVVADSEGKVNAAWGDERLNIYLRSSAKPLQALPLVGTGAAAHWALTPRELALCCASHMGTDAHVEVARRILRKAEVSPEWLQCRSHDDCGEPAFCCAGPTDSLEATLRHNCSGKHSGMLATAKFRGESLADYREPSHPVQQRILDAVSEFAHLPRSALEATVIPDGCGAPIFAMPLVNLAQAYARFASADGAAQTLRDAMTAHPEMVAGPGQPNTILLQQLGDLLVCKSGAEGAFGLGLRSGLGLAMKVTDGSHRVSGMAALAILRTLRLIPEARLSPLREMAEPDVRNGHGILVGRMQIRI